jgi:hypothetical protein
MGYQTPRSHADHTICGLSDGSSKLIWEQYDRPQRLLFDLRTDPHEQAPTLSGPAVEAAHQRLLAWLRHPDRPPTELTGYALGRS